MGASKFCEIWAEFEWLTQSHDPQRASGPQKTAFI